MDNNRLTIVYILPSLADRGGQERIETDKMNALAATGRYDVCAICVWQRKDEANAFDLSPAVRQVRMGEVCAQPRPFARAPLAYVARWLRWQWRVKRRTDALLSEMHADVVVTAANYVPLSFCTFRGKRLVESHADIASLTGIRTMPRLARWLTCLIARRASAVVTLTLSDARQWTAARRVEVIPNFTGLQPVAPCDYRSRRVVALGRLCEQKGFDLLVEAWKTVAEHHPDWCLDIYGEGVGHSALQRQIADGGLEAVVHLHPFTTDVAAAYATAAFYVMSSRYEGFGLVLIEAMRCGLPCVSYDCPSGPSEIITHGRDGLLVPYRGLSQVERVSDLAAALCRMMDHEEQLPTMGLAARETAQRYTAENVIPMWERLFREG